MTGRKPRTLNAGELWTYSLRILGGRAHSIGEMREKLKRRAAQAGDVEDTLHRLKECGYLNDQRYAEGFASARLANDQFGKGRVIQDLRQHRIAPALAERAAQKVYEDVNEQTLIDEWIRRKYRSALREGLFHEEKDFASAYRRLLRAGFRPGEILRALKRFAANPELLDGFEPPEEPMEEV